ncbi:putative vacuolar protein-sorting-associated protein 25 protein [Phaeoacremonium minimum UCRPA7]|uniref:ESCRT-II complex subunit VPS25 n=1 Tax=Phaeoacremonium minimum (strain UCR-PA7) TaxID=1286976 RepID=R8BK74_PHAM7|nr:putative vacuolar protein-sorting-associated protein 25 protein [Phaeoacremonium minimum UCRPA7]EON99753.1 putative vacuolar protein-sorting-associated protein 25 protein [Phaeoacremonium minimum UCRPA7]
MASTAPAPFDFPREYFFPAFFTRQTNLTTLHAQLLKWSSLILAYCKHHRIFKLSLSSSVPASSATVTLAASTTATTNNGSDAPPSSTAAAEELFYNKKLDRRLALADVREVIDFMRKDGRAEYVGGAGATAGDVVWIYWRTPEEWAALVEAWVDETAQKGTVLTLYELTEGEATRGTEFHGLDPDLLQKALSILVKRGKAQIFGQEDSQGVKFF